MATPPTSPAAEGKTGPLSWELCPRQAWTRRRSVGAHLSTCFWGLMEAASQACSSEGWAECQAAEKTLGGEEGAQDRLQGEEREAQRSPRIIRVKRETLRAKGRVGSLQESTWPQDRR